MSDKVNVVVSKPENFPEIGGEKIALSLIEGWEDLTDRQQKYLTLYAQNPMTSRAMIAMELGYTTSEVDNWFKGESFGTVANTIYDIYTDILRGIDYSEALSNSKIRSRVIQARENGGRYTKESKPTTHQHLHLKDGEFSLRDLLGS